MRRWCTGPVAAVLVVGFVVSGLPSQGAGPGKGAAPVAPVTKGASPGARVAAAPGSASQVLPPAVASGAEYPGDEDGPSFPFTCPECGYGAQQGGFCPVCHIPLVEETADSPDTEHPSEDSGEDALEDAEAIDPNS